LHGFENASVQHLYANFLDGRASVRRAEEDELRVTLDRPPLHLVLSMSGLIHQPHSIPWLGRSNLIMEWTH
jgi:hypothetical protein